MPTTVIALIIFKETVPKRLWLSIFLITVASILLSFEKDGLSFSLGSLFVIGATICWGLENNCTRKISDKSIYQIVTIKGLCSGTGSIIVAFILFEKIPDIKYIIFALMLGFVAYGLSIFTYIRAQKTLGAAKTSAYYAIAPFIGVLLSFVVLGEKISLTQIIALIIMIVGTIMVVIDTFIKSHSHKHEHIFEHTHNGITHTHTIAHAHIHTHYLKYGIHKHQHSIEELEKEL